MVNIVLTSHSRPTYWALPLWFSYKQFPCPSFITIIIIIIIITITITIIIMIIIMIIIIIIIIIIYLYWQS